MSDPRVCEDGDVSDSEEQVDDHKSSTLVTCSRNEADEVENGSSLIWEIYFRICAADDDQVRMLEVIQVPERGLEK